MEAAKPRMTYAEFQAAQAKHREGTVAWVLERYHNEMQSGERPFGDSITYRLKALQKMPFASLQARAVKRQDVIEFARWRRKQVWRGKQIGPATVIQDLTVLVGAFKYAGAAWNDMDGLTATPFTEAKPFLVKHQVIAKSQPRDRRPTLAELEALLDYFRARNDHRNTKVDMALITIWQVASGRRVGETCRLQWADWNRDKRIILVRKMKDPRRKKDKWVALTDEATAILEALWEVRDPNEPRVMPYNHRTVIAAYVQAKKALGINGLRLHDSRRECATRLAAKGYSSKLVALVTGHEPGSRVLDRTYVSLSAEEFHSATVGA